MSTPNAEFISVWNEILVPKFTRFRHVLVTGFRGHSDHALAKHRPAEGASIIDVGCGFGETSIELANIVGPRGHVLGIDCCDAFIETARRDAKEAGVANVTFEVKDAQTTSFEPRFDMIFARFGTMFFQSPRAAMTNLGRGLRPGGKLVMVVWRALEDNPCFDLPKKVVLRHLPPPPDNGQSCGPGPFSMSEEGTVTAILESSGFSDVSFERVDLPINIGRTVDEAIEFQLQLGPAGELVREAGALAEERRELIVKDLREALASHFSSDAVSMGSSSWTVTARRAN